MLTANTTLQHGRYRIIRPIGQGGMGAVYEAYDNNLSNRVALKEALVSDATLRRAFEQEAKRLDRLRHVALPTVKDHFTEAGGQYLVMEYIEGQDLEQMLKQRHGPFAVPQVLAWADTLLDALGYLHEEGVIHRDIKPANIKLTPRGQIILLDFGLAKGGLTLRYSNGNSLFGYSLGYAPLEQMEGEPTDERSDLYALGATLYALLAGRRPDDPISRQRYIDRGYPDPLQPANEVNTQVPLYVARALQQATAIARVQRPASAAQMRAMLNPPRPQPVAPPESTIRVPSTQQAPRVAQTTSYSQPISSPAAPISSVDTTNGGNNKQMLLWGAMIVAGLLVGVLIWVYGMGDGGSETAKDGMVEVYVPAGEFEMGSANDDFDAADDEKPRHAVYLDAFWIDKTEVTNAMYGQCVAAGTCAPPSSNGSRTQDSYYGNASFDNYPVLYVSWDDANAYCAWAGRRLPTEAEWEKAAAGSDGRKYPWGNDAPNDSLANFDFNVGDTSPVGNYPAGASPYGALDMAGNVWEWVLDSYDSNYYASSPRENPTGPLSGMTKLFRGGSWGNTALDIRVRNRDRDDASDRSGNVGFRCARSER